MAKKEKREKETLSMPRRIIKLISILLFLSGACILAYPWARASYISSQNNRLIEEFDNMRLTGEESVQTEDDGAKSASEDGETLPSDFLQGGFSELYTDMAAYNREIFENGQTGLHDAWDYEQETFSLEDYGLENGIAGYLESDAMGICLPLYIGASSEHLAEGAAVLGQTSMPIGGENTNCVIAGHRGWQGAPMFRDIEELQEGDIIWITNPWERLAYRVVRITVITPDDIDAVKIVEGQDMLTLFTCHPYTDNYQRYVVYCTRTHDAVYGETTYEEPPEADSGLNSLLDEKQREHPEFVSSSDRISREKTLSVAGLGGAAILVVILVIYILLSVKKKKGRRSKRRRVS